MTLFRGRWLAGAALVAGVGLIAAGSAEAQRAEGSFERTLTVGQHPDIEIQSGSGSIEVRQGAADRVEVRGRIRAGEWGSMRGRLSAEERVKRLETSPPIEQRGNSIRIGHIEDDDLQDGVSISYEVTIPPGSALRSKSGSGSQRIEGVDGNVETGSGSGSLTVRRSGGRVRASTGSGGITAEEIGGEFQASTGSGSIDGTGIRGPITASTSSGHIEVTQGAPGDVEVSSSSGSVRVRGVQGGLRASTSSGSLTIEHFLHNSWTTAQFCQHPLRCLPGALAAPACGDSGACRTT